MSTNLKPHPLQPNPQILKLIYIYNAKYGMFQNQAQLQHYLRNSLSAEHFQGLELEVKLRSSAFIIHSLMVEQNTLYDNVETIIDHLYILNTEAKFDESCNSVVFQLDLKIRLLAMHQLLLHLKSTYPPAPVSEITDRFNEHMDNLFNCKIKLNSPEEEKNKKSKLKQLKSVLYLAFDSLIHNPNKNFLELKEEEKHEHVQIAVLQFVKEIFVKFDIKENTELENLINTQK